MATLLPAGMFIFLRSFNPKVSAPRKFIEEHPDVNFEQYLKYFSYTMVHYNAQ